MTYILLKLCKSLADSILDKDHGLSVRPALHRFPQHPRYGGVKQRRGRGAVSIAGGESWDDGWIVHMDATAEQKMRSVIISNRHILYLDW